MGNPNPHHLTPLLRCVLQWFRTKLRMRSRILTVSHSTGQQRDNDHSAAMRHANGVVAS